MNIQIYAKKRSLKSDGTGPPSPDMTATYEKHLAFWQDHPKVGWLSGRYLLPMWAPV